MVDRFGAKWCARNPDRKKRGCVCVGGVLGLGICVACLDILHQWEIAADTRGRQAGRQGGRQAFRPSKHLNILNQPQGAALPTTRGQHQRRPSREKQRRRLRRYFRPCPTRPDPEYRERDAQTLTFSFGTAEETAFQAKPN